MDPVTNSWIAPRDQGQAVIAAPKGRSGKAARSEAARDADLARRLWDVSVEMTGVDPGL